MRSVVYARVSTLDQASEEKVSIPDQINWAKELSKERGWDFLHSYIEPGVKGYAEFENREAARELFDDASKDKFDVVLVYHSSRIARESDLILKFHRILANNKIQVFCRNIPSDVLNKESYYWGGNYTQQIMTALAGVQDQQENVARSERVRSGFRGIAQKGILVNAPYGYEKRYKINKDGKKEWSWVVVQKEAIIVNEIFDCYGDKSMSIRGIMQYLNDIKKVLSPKGSLWSSSSIKNILNNPAYIQKVRWGRKLGSRYKQGISSAGKQKRVILPESDWILVNGNHPRIINDELFYRVQNRLKDRAEIHGRSIASPGLLTGLVKCGICGKNAYHKAKRVRKKDKTGKVNESIRFDYICQTYISKGKNHCRRHVMSASKIEDLVIKDISEVVNQASKREKIFYTGTKSNLTYLIEKKELLSVEIKKLEMESKRIIKAYSKGVLTLNEMGDERKRIEKDSMIVQKELDLINKKINNIDKTKSAKYRLKKIAGRFIKAFKDGSFDTQKEILHSLIESVVVDKNGNVKINYRLD